MIIFVPPLPSNVIYNIIVCACQCFGCYAIYVSVFYVAKLVVLCAIEEYSIVPLCKLRTSRIHQDLYFVRLLQ